MSLGGGDGKIRFIFSWGVERWDGGMEMGFLVWGSVMVSCCFLYI